MPPPADTAPALAAATTVLLRDSDAGCEVLLVQRSAKLAFHGGAWVFPGGRVDAADAIGDAGTAGDTDPRRADPARGPSAARRAAVREAREEADVALAEGELVLISRWTTPLGLPKRFDTWFFAAVVAGAEVRVDGGEIHAHRWIRPGDALHAQRAGALELPPPTFVTLAQLAPFEAARSALEALSSGPAPHFFPRIHRVPRGLCSLYAGDAGYEAGDPDAPGPRHRLWMLETGWRLERSG